jgi:hypothetical protein
MTPQKDISCTAVLASWTERSKRVLVRFRLWVATPTYMILSLLVIRSERNILKQIVKPLPLSDVPPPSLAVLRQILQWSRTL